MDDVDGQLYAHHAPDLVRLTTMLVGPADAEDVFADSVVNAMRSSTWQRLDDDAKAGYLYRTVVNQARQWARTRSRRQRREALWAARDGVRAEPVAADDEVWRSVIRLSERQRAVVFLTYWLDLDGATVAERLGISEGSVRQHLARARERLRRTIDA